MFTSLTLSLSLTLLTFLPPTHAHGYLSLLATPNQIYYGNAPRLTSFPSPIRLVNDIVPVKGASNPDLNCGIQAQKAEMVVEVQAGEAVTFGWSAGDNGFWQHNTGPMLTYLASCGNTTSDLFDAQDAQWFKIDQVGKMNGSAWFQSELNVGNTYTTHLPTNLPAGDYLIRHEIIALQLAAQVGGAEFYPSCSQIRVLPSNSSTSTTSPTTTTAESSSTPILTVKLPGAYADTDPGLFVPSIFDPNADYTAFPGPDVDVHLNAGEGPEGGVAITGPDPAGPRSVVLGGVSKRGVRMERRRRV